MMGDVFNFAIFERDHERSHDSAKRQGDFLATQLCSEKWQRVSWLTAQANENRSETILSKSPTKPFSDELCLWGLLYATKQQQNNLENDCSQEKSLALSHGWADETAEVYWPAKEISQRFQLFGQGQEHRTSNLSRIRNHAASPQSIPFESPKTTMMNRMNDLCWLQTAFQAEASTRSHIWLPLCLIATRMERNWDQYYSFQKDELQRDWIFFRDTYQCNVFLHWETL